MNTKRIVLLALFIAISAILSNFKIFSTIALDSMPAFLAAILISPIAGAFVGALGHLLTAYTSGFPFTIPMHLFVSLQMFSIVWIFGMVFKKSNQFIAIFIAILLNGPIATYFSGLLFILIDPKVTVMGFFKLMVIPLTLVSTVNIVVAVIIQKVMRRAGINI